MHKAISWNDLVNYGLVRLRDEELSIELVLYIILWEEDKVILECGDHIYSIVIPLKMWEDGRFTFIIEDKK